MANEETPLDFYGSLQTFEEAARLWEKISEKVKEAWDRSRSHDDKPAWRAITEAGRMLDQFEEKRRLIAQRADEETVLWPADPFYPWLHEALLFQGYRNYHTIYEPMWYMGSVEHRLEALKDSLSGAEL